MMDKIVIVGAGQAGCQLAVSLRDFGHVGPIVLVGEEEHLPYQRPQLSKSFLGGLLTADDLRIKSEGYFIEKSIEYIRPVRATRISRKEMRLFLSSGADISFDRLVLATGVSNRRLAIPHAQFARIIYLRTVDDAHILKRELQASRYVVVVGAGFIGMEFAAVARQHGLEVTVVEAADRSMARAVSVPVSRHIEERHIAEGVRFRFGTTPEAFELDQDGELAALRLADGERIPCDFALVAIGVNPNTTLAEDSGLDVRNGIVVDQTLTTTDPSIHAIGDCAQFVHPLYPERDMRLESVQNATDQARYLARKLTGSSGIYESTPWFWSEQFDLKLQIAGLTKADDDIELVGDPQTGSFSVKHSSCQKFTALETINSVRDHMLARQQLKQSLRT